MLIERSNRLLPSELAACDFSFEVEAEIPLPLIGLAISSTIPVAPHRKTYPIDPSLLARAGGNVERAIFVARQSRLVGYVAVSRAWNNVAQIDDLAVDRPARRSGIASELLRTAIAWARQAGLAGVRLETQADNVAACTLYHRLGFELAGFDRERYRGLEPEANEIALFWYLFF